MFGCRDSWVKAAPASPLCPGHPTENSLAPRCPAWGRREMVVQSRASQTLRRKQISWQFSLKCMLQFMSSSRKGKAVPLPHTDLVTSGAFGFHDGGCSQHQAGGSQDAAEHPGAKVGPAPATTAPRPGSPHEMTEDWVAGFGHCAQCCWGPV